MTERSEPAIEDLEATTEDADGVVGGASEDYFLKIDGIKGESQDDRHKDFLQ